MKENSLTVPVVELLNVHKGFDGKDIISHFNLTINNGAVSYTHLTLPTICSV